MRGIRTDRYQIVLPVDLHAIPCIVEQTNAIGASQLSPKRHYGRTHRLLVRVDQRADREARLRETACNRFRVVAQIGDRRLEVSRIANDQRQTHLCPGPSPPRDTIGTISASTTTRRATAQRAQRTRQRRANPDPRLPDRSLLPQLLPLMLKRPSTSATRKLGSNPKHCISEPSTSPTRIEMRVTARSHANTARAQCSTGSTSNHGT
jgi:hypothetical protein